MNPGSDIGEEDDSHLNLGTVKIESAEVHMDYEIALAGCIGGCQQKAGSN